MKSAKFARRALLKLRRFAAGSVYGYFTPAEVLFILDYFGKDKCRIRVPGYDDGARRKLYMERVLERLRMGDCGTGYHYFEVDRAALDAFEESLDYPDCVRFNPERRRKPVQNNP